MGSLVRLLNLVFVRVEKRVFREKYFRGIHINRGKHKTWYDRQSSKYYYCSLH